MKDSDIQKLIFIYNADSGLKNALLDSAHKILNPSTYNCNLCDITFGVFTENKIWKQFREQTDLEMEFLHKDEYKKQYASKFGNKFGFPIILAQGNGELQVFVSTEEMNTIEDAQSLIRLIEERVKA
ncbi:GTPase [Zobellia galactanivorans]|uniref:GTPase n=1 Tax=Zobellia galactanivorans (strain DSM 12802 / CCUG 47099 / CIP 106680 / NCIMB 13871 / Dsij) TaxID=63186 RepID=UPI001C06DCAC|nr:GTPase [Zobellia galactanivorans]MBU3027439.1 GTPase [Zobellia galactanivorans]